MHVCVVCVCSQRKAKRRDVDAEMGERQRLDALKTFTQSLERWKPKEEDDEATRRQKELEEQLHDHRMKVLHMGVGHVGGCGEGRVP